MALADASRLLCRLSQAGGRDACTAAAQELGVKRGDSLWRRRLVAARTAALEAPVGEREEIVVGLEASVAL